MDPRYSGHMLEETVTERRKPAVARSEPRMVILHAGGVVLLNRSSAWVSKTVKLKFVLHGSPDHG